MACGPRNQAFDLFRRRHSHPKSSEKCILLVDSETAVAAKSPWEHLRNRQEDGWKWPEDATDDQCHLMVQCMEAWFIADRETLERFYGNGFRASALPANRNSEEALKEDLLQSLVNATRETTKGGYHKGEVSFQLLEKLVPERVMDASPWAKRFVDTLLHLAGPA